MYNERVSFQKSLIAREQTHMIFRLTTYKYLCPDLKQSVCRKKVQNLSVSERRNRIGKKSILKMD